LNAKTVRDYVCFKREHTDAAAVKIVLFPDFALQPFLPFHGDLARVQPINEDLECGWLQVIQDHLSLLAFFPVLL
jgi:hypothetical protein